MSKKAVRDWLTGNTSIADRVSNRIHNGRVPQGGSLPAIVLTTITKDHEYSLANEIGLTEFVMQVDVYGEGPRGPLDVEEISELVRLRLSGYRGQLNDDVFCHAARLIRNSESFDKPADASDDWTPRVSMDFSLSLTTAVPTH